MTELSSTPKKWSVTAINSPRTAELLLGYNLDSPTDGMELPSGQPATVQGWAVAKGGAKDNLHLVFRSQGAALAYPMNAPRADVVAHVHRTWQGEDAPLVSGFRYEIPTQFLGAETVLGFELDGCLAECFRISILE